MASGSEHPLFPHPAYSKLGEFFLQKDVDVYDGILIRIFHSQNGGQNLGTSSKLILGHLRGPRVPNANPLKK